MRGLSWRRRRKAHPLALLPALDQDPRPAIQGVTLESRQRLQRLLEVLVTEPVTPTIRELGRFLGLCSTSSVWLYLQALHQHGLIRRAPGHPRSGCITEKGWEFLAR